MFADPFRDDGTEIRGLFHSANVTRTTRSVRMTAEIRMCLVKIFTRRLLLATDDFLPWRSRELRVAACTSANGLSSR